MTPLSVTTPSSTDQLTPSATSTTTNNSLTSLSATNFVQFLITELQNQDPLSPTSSDQMLSQLSEIGQLQSSTDLDTDLKGLVQQNQVASASSFIGKQVDGTDQNNNTIQGIVTNVQVTTNGVSLGLDNGSSLSLSGVTSITNAPAATPAATTPAAAAPATTTPAPPAS